MNKQSSIAGPSTVPISDTKNNAAASPTTETEHRMKLAYLVNQYPTVSHTFIRREILELERRGHEITRITIRRGHGPLVDSLDQAEADATLALLGTPLVAWLIETMRCMFTQPAGFLRASCTMWQLSRVSDRGLIRHLAYLAEAIVLARICRERQIRHVHTHFGTNSAAVALLAARLSGLTYSLTIHGSEEFDGPVALSLSRKVAHAAFVVAISHFGKGQLYRWAHPDDWQKIHVVRCTVDEVFFDRAKPVDEKADTLVCVGRLSAPKGQFILLDAFARAVKEGCRLKLILAGDGELREDIEAHIRSHQLQEHVRITGWISGEQVREHLLQSRGLIQPSFAEGLPVVIMEALALGRPVIATFVAGIPELVRDNVNGWLVPAGDVAALTEAIHAIAKAPAQQLTDMGRRGIDAARAAHRVQTEVDKLEQYLREVC